MVLPRARWYSSGTGDDSDTNRPWNKYPRPTRWYWRADLSHILPWSWALVSICSHYWAFPTYPTYGTTPVTQNEWVLFMLMESECRAAWVGRRQRSNWLKRLSCLLVLNTFRKKAMPLCRLTPHLPDAWVRHVNAPVVRNTRHRNALLRSASRKRQNVSIPQARRSTNQPWLPSREKGYSLPCRNCWSSKSFAGILPNQTLPLPSMGGIESPATKKKNEPTSFLASCL